MAHVGSSDEGSPGTRPRVSFFGSSRFALVFTIFTRSNSSCRHAAKDARMQRHSPACDALSLACDPNISLLLLCASASATKLVRGATSSLMLGWREVTTASKSSPHGGIHAARAHVRSWILFLVDLSPKEPQEPLPNEPHSLFFIRSPTEARAWSAKFPRFTGTLQRIGHNLR